MLDHMCHSYVLNGWQETHELTIKARVKGYYMQLYILNYVGDEMDKVLLVRLARINKLLNF